MLIPNDMIMFYDEKVEGEVAEETTPVTTEAEAAPEVANAEGEAAA